MRSEGRSGASANGAARAAAAGAATKGSRNGFTAANIDQSRGLAHVPDPGGVRVEETRHRGRRSGGRCDYLRHQPGQLGDSSGGGDEG